MNWDDLTKDIAAAARISFSDLINQHGNEKFYAFILYTDNDCYTILPSANSIEKYNEKISIEGINDSKNMTGYKWYIGEWAYEAWKNNEFKDICKK